MRKQGLIVAVLCALLMLMLAGCGLGSAELSSVDRSTAPPTQVVVATPEATAEATPEPTPETQPTADVTEGAEKALDVWEVDKAEEDQGVASDPQQEDVIGGPLSQTMTGTEGYASLDLVNYSDRDVCFVYISLAASDSWGDDWLGSEEVISPGYYHTFEMPAETYDLMALDCDKEIMDDIRNAYLSGDMQWTIGEGGPPPRPTATPNPTTAAAPPGVVYPTPTPGAVSAFLCCGTTPGETGTIWSVNYPVNWYVTLLPNNPQQFFGALFTEPEGKVTITFIPGSNTEPGHELDTGNVDDFLNRYTTIRQREERGFEEILRKPLPGVPSGRLWAGTWGSGSDRSWEAYLVTVDPMLQVAPGLPQGYLMMYGFRAPSRDWYNAESIFDQMWNSMQVKRFGGNPEGLPPREPNQKPIMIRWCPDCCDWVAVEADRENWACPHCGNETYLWETPCK